MAAPALAARPAAPSRPLAKAHRLAIPAIALLLVAVAAGARFILFDRIEFKYDEAQVATLALALVRQHVVPQSSILTSGGFHNSPLFVYFVALPLLISPSPYALTGFITALNALAAGGLYLTARRVVGEAVAVGAALLFALDPLAVHYARKIWAPDLMPPFTLLWFAGLLVALGEGRAWGLLLALPALAVLAQLHQAAAVLLPVTALLLVVFARRLAWHRWGTWLAFGGGLAAFAALAAPYGLYEAQHGFADVRGMLDQVSTHPTWTAEPWLALWWLAAGWRPDLFFADLAAQEHLTLAGAGLLDWLALGLALLALATCLVWLWRPAAPWLVSGAASRSRRVTGAALLLAVLAPPAAMSRGAAPILPHYLVFLSPLLALLVALGAGATAVLAGGAARLAAGQRVRATVVGSRGGTSLGTGKQGEPWLAPTEAVSARTLEGARPDGSKPPIRPRALVASLYVLLIGALLLTAVVRQARFDRALLTHQAGGDYGTPLNYSIQAANTLRSAPRAFLMGAGGDFLAVYHYLQAIDVAPPAAQIDPALALALPPAGVGATYLYQQTDSAAYRATAAVASPSGVGADQAAASSGRPPSAAAISSAPNPGAAYALFQLTPAQVRQLDASLRAGMAPAGPYRVGPGLTLTAAAVPTPAASGPLVVRLAWQIADPAPYAAQPVRMFVHLYDAKRQTVAQADSLGDPAADWRAGDRLFTWFLLQPNAPLAPGRYTLVAGLYVVDGFKAFPVVGPKGEQLGGEIPLGSITVQR